MGCEFSVPLETGPETPTLKTFKEYAGGQNNIIKSVLMTSAQAPTQGISTKYFRPCSSGDWQNFYKVAWEAKDIEAKRAVQRGEKGQLRSELLPAGFQKECNVITRPGACATCWSFDCTKLLVRDEYREVENIAIDLCLKDAAFEVLLLIGQPGMGKSACLLYLLLRRMALGLPTALQRDNGVFLFFSGGVMEFSKLDDPQFYNAIKPLELKSRIWVLLDLNHRSPTPAAAFRCRAFFVIATVCPHDSCYGGWIDQRKVRYYYVTPWTLDELLMVRSLIRSPMTESALFDMHQKYGLPLRYLFTTEEDQNEVAIRKMVKDRIEPEALIKELWKKDDAHLALSFGPVNQAHFPMKINFTTPYVLSQICMHSFSNNHDDIGKLYYHLRRDPSTERAADMVFRLRAHQYLRDGKNLKLHRIRSTTVKHGNDMVEYSKYESASADFTPEELVLDLTRSQEFVFHEDTLPEIETNYYYRSSKLSYPTIDSWILQDKSQPAGHAKHKASDKTASSSSSKDFAFWKFIVTVNIERRNLREASVSRLATLVQPHVPRYTVIVTFGDRQPAIFVPKKCLPSVDFHTYSADELFAVYNLPLHEEILFPQPHGGRT